MQRLDVMQMLDSVLERKGRPETDAERLEREEYERGRDERAKRTQADTAKLVRSRRVADLPITADDKAAIVEGALRDVPALAATKRWMKIQPSPWLVLLGGNGTGKSCAAAYALAELGGEFVTAMQVRPTMTRAVWEGAAMPSIVTTRFLVVDDLGTENEKDPESFVTTFFELLNRRQDRMTIITSNLSKTRLAEPTRYGTRIVDRIKHNAHVLELRGESMRVNKGGL